MLNLSTTTMIESCCFYVFAKLVMKSRDMISHFHRAIGRGCNKLARCQYSVLTCWHFMHLDRYSITSDFKPGQKNCFLREVTIFWYPRWSVKGGLRISFIIKNLISNTLVMYNLSLNQIKPFWSTLKAAPSKFICYFVFY